MDFKLFEGKALHRALVKAGYKVGERTVQRWTSGESQPTLQQEMAVRAVLDAEESPPRSFDFDGLMDTVDSIAVTVKAMTKAEAQRRAAERLRARYAADGQVPPGRAGAGKSGGPTRRARVPRPREPQGGQ